MDEDIIYELVADIREDGANYIVIKVPQEGQGTRHIHATVTDGGVPKELPIDSAVTYTCKGHNAAGGAIDIECELEDNKIVIPITQSMVAFHGIGKYRMEIFDTRTEIPTLSSFTFCIAVEQDPLTATEVVASDDYQLLRDLIAQAQNVTSNWLIGTGVPPSSLGENLDLYLDIDTSKVYKKTNGTWSYQGSLGSQVYFAYATSNQGANFSTTYNGTQTYLGLYSGQAETQPLTPASYTWIEIAGGDNMRKADYGGSDNYTVAQADTLKGVVEIRNITIPANTSTSTTVVTVTDQRITASCYVEGVYTTLFGLNLMEMSLGVGTLSMTFPASSTSATAVVRLYTTS